MSIVRIAVVDPNPRSPKDDIVVYQVPEKSRALELLTEMLERNSYEWVVVEFPGRKRKAKPVLIDDEEA